MTGGSHAFQETIPFEIAKTMPTIRRVLIFGFPVRHFFRLCIVIGFGFFFLHAPPGWLLLFDLFSVAFFALFATVFVAGTHYIARSLVQTTLMGSTISVHDGRIVFRGDNRETLEYPLNECTWTEISDLQTETHNRAFPHQACIIVFPPGIRLFDRKPLIACGFTDEMREAWKDRLTESGAIKNTAQSSRFHAPNR